ncbi:MAG: ABC transporter permease, partial [Candidatus Heimdallarchaeota archaeon]|nr:ABC transporter permease [Candidatus Heimdallarchaeota archaeon]
MNNTLFFAIKYLGFGQKRAVISFLSILGISLSVFVLVIVLSVMNGFHNQLMDSIIGINGPITISRYSSGISNYKDLCNKINQVDGVTSVMPTIKKQALLSFRDNAYGLLIKGVDKELLLNHSLINNKMVYGNLDNFNEKSIIIGKQIAVNLNISIGDEVSLITMSHFKTLLGSTPRIVTVKVIGIFELGYYEYDNSLAYIPLELSQKLFGFSKNKVNDIEIFIDNIKNTWPIYLDVQNVADIKVSNWMETQSGYIKALNIEKNTMFLILFMVILIASFNLIGNLLMLVAIKRESIAILRTIGASKFFIARIFITCGSILSLIGISIGMILGVLVAKYMNEMKYFLDHYLSIQWIKNLSLFLQSIPIDIIPSDLIFVGLITFLISFLITIIPSFMAAK